MAPTMVEAITAVLVPVTNGNDDNGNSLEDAIHMFI